MEINQCIVNTAKKIMKERMTSCFLPGFSPQALTVSFTLSKKYWCGLNRVFVGTDNTKTIRSFSVPWDICSTVYSGKNRAQNSTNWFGLSLSSGVQKYSFSENGNEMEIFFMMYDHMISKIMHHITILQVHLGISISMKPYSIKKRYSIKQTLDWVR